MRIRSRTLALTCGWKRSEARADAGSRQGQCVVRRGVGSGFYASPSTSRSATSFVLPVARLLVTNCSRPI